MTRLALVMVVGVAALALAGCVGNTDPATNVTDDSAKLNAHGHTNNGPAYWWWEYATDASALGTASDVELCGTNTRCGPAASSNDVSLSTKVTGLMPDTTYYFRACGQDQAAGSRPACGRILSFKTLALPDPVVAAAGDIACGAASTDSFCKQQATADVVSAINPNAVLALGDNQYEAGSLTDFNSYYGPTWGKWRSITRPVAGNHEYGTSGASGYFDYFNGQGALTGLAGDRTKGYYSWDIGTWHMVALNSNCTEIGGCGAGSPQETWLRADLAAHPASCTLAYMHHPRWSSDVLVGNTPAVAPLVQALYDNHVDLMLAGHAHTYERFAAQDPAGNADANGVVEIIVGTGGKSEFGFGATTLPNSQIHADVFGALQLTLHGSSYDWRFVPAAGDSFSDSGAARCH